MRALLGLLTVFSLSSFASTPLVGRVTGADGQSLSCVFEDAPIVAMAPNLATIIDDLGARKQLVGVASLSYWKPASSVKSDSSIQDVGPFHDPSIEKILLLKPKLLVVLKQGTPLKLVESLKKQADLKVFALDIQNLDSLKSAYLSLGCLLGRATEARRLVSKFDADFEQLRSRIQSKTIRNDSHVVLLGAQPLIAVNKGTYTHSVLQALGFNLLDLPFKTSYPELNLEFLTKNRPQRIIYVCHKSTGNQPKLLEPIPTIHLESESWIQPSLRIIEGLRELEKLL